MVFKPINLARSVISKTFPNGYAQSLVAASQTSSASHNTHFSTLGSGVVNYFGKAAPSVQNQTHNAPPNTHHAAGSNKPDTSNTATERGLDAYYAAWQKHHKEEEKEWHQFQFAKRIGWKAPTTIPEAQHQSKPAQPSRPSHLERPSRISIHRAQSASAVDDIKPSQDASLPAKAVAPSSEEIRQSIADVQQPAPDAAIATSQANNSAVVSATATSDASPPPSSIQVSSPAQSTQATSISDFDPYTNQLALLAEEHRHGETPATFEAMLREGFKPTPTAYNALLLAAINLPKGKHQIIPKVLDVYSDMLSRRVAPDTSTYAILIEVLAARALDVQSMKAELLQRQARYGSIANNTFLFASDEAEYRILAEDDSLSLAIKLFDTSAATTTNHAFTAETYSAIISACAEQGRINDMVRLYAEMESQQILPSTSIFAPMIRAFAGSGDLRSAVECYQEYKALAVAHDQGLKTIMRKDAEVYAAVVKAYALCEQINGGLKFMGKIEEAFRASSQLSAIRDATALQALIPHWIKQESYATVFEHSSQLSPEARAQALAAVATYSADKSQIGPAAEAFSVLQAQFATSAMTTDAAGSVLAAHARNNDVLAARKTWQFLLQSRPDIGSVEAAIAYLELQTKGQNMSLAVSEARGLFSQIRAAAVTEQDKFDTLERIDEAINIASRRFLQTTAVPQPAVSIELLQAMAENETVSNNIAEHLFAPLGPNDISSLQSSVVISLSQLQAGLIVDRPQVDIGHTARLMHLVELIGSRGIPTDSRTSRLIEQALKVMGRSELITRLQQSAVAPRLSPTQYSTAPITSMGSPSFDEAYDPYASTTDFKGSNIIAEELEKTQGRFAGHLNEALTRFRNMRRAGRHPRYVTYGRLITAAAKDNRGSLAQDILAMAKQDVPLIPHSRIVVQGWVNILDSMVSACLTMGKRDMATQYHNELLAMGFAPSANTFGLYITTLKESTKTFDEATEAVKIFHRAKQEMVEPTSFLYNALIGKLGKARRIDDCLFYFAEMRQLGIRPTSVTYGTIVNALCRVSDDKFAEELFEEMESMPNYKPRPAPYNSLMQYFLTTKRDRSKVLSYYQRMLDSNIEPTMHTYKLLIDTHATLEPVDMAAAESVLAEVESKGMRPEAVHYAAIIHAQGCQQHDLPAARATFDRVITEQPVQPCASLYQAIFESMVANHDVSGTDVLLEQMRQQGVVLTPYIANTLIHGWASSKDINKARSVYEALGMGRREPSTYEAMTRAYLAVEDRGNARATVGEALRRGYPAAVAGKICDLVGGA